MKYAKAALAVFLITAFSVLQSVCALPNAYTMVKGQTHRLSSPLAVSTESAALRVNNGTVIPTAEGTYVLDFSLPGIFRKSAVVNVVEPTDVVLGGNAVGIKLYMEGVLVVGMSEIPGSDGHRTPGRESDIRIGDRIMAVNGNALKNSDGLADAVHSGNGAAMMLTVCRDGEELSKTVTPAYYPAGEAYKLGLWVRDSAAGIGTVTFSMPHSGAYAALGHGIEDGDAATMIRIREGSITDCEVAYVEKGEQGLPGEMRGVFGTEERGSIAENTAIGIYGKLDTPPSGGTILPVAAGTQVHRGDATLYTDVCGNGVEGYAVRVERVLSQNEPNSKSMIVRVTDERLLAATGGIIQGMSGSPIVQDGCLAGAVTHVFVNDPTMGYGIFAQWMTQHIEAAAA